MLFRYAWDASRDRYSCVKAYRGRSRGKITDEKGMLLNTPLDVRKRVNIIASNGIAHEKLLELV